MSFLIALVLIVLVQWFHLQLLRLELPERLHRWLPWSLGLFHMPLVLFALMRAGGLGGHGALPFLSAASRFAFYFQAFTILHLILAMFAEGIWRISRLGHPADLEAEETEEAPEDSSRRAFLRTAAVASTGAAAILGVGGSREAYGDPRITRLDLSFKDLPSGLDGLRIAQLSDLHAGPLVGPTTLRRWRDLTEREHPELLLFTGDLVDSRPDELTPLLEAFQGWTPSLGRFAVLGNHDFFDDPRPIWRDLEAAGIRCLENATTLIQRGGAINPIPGFNSARLIGPRTEGLYREGEDLLYVSRGLGVVGLPMRLAAAPEIVILTLKRG
jgi:hypothetical protein